jgi:hypothetical protein
MEKSKIVKEGASRGVSTGLFWAIQVNLVLWLAMVPVAIQESDSPAVVWGVSAGCLLAAILEWLVAKTH